MRRGALSAGRDLYRAKMPIVAANTFCGNNEECIGFTYAAEEMPAKDAKPDPFMPGAHISPYLPIPPPYLPIPRAGPVHAGRAAAHRNREREKRGRERAGDVTRRADAPGENPLIYFKSGRAGEAQVNADKQRTSYLRLKSHNTSRSTENRSTQTSSGPPTSKSTTRLRLSPRRDRCTTGQRDISPHLPTSPHISPYLTHLSAAGCMVAGHLRVRKVPGVLKLVLHSPEHDHEHALINSSHAVNEFW